jgi:hypothetical protein
MIIFESRATHWSARMYQNGLHVESDYNPEAVNVTGMHRCNPVNCTFTGEKLEYRASSRSDRIYQNEWHVQKWLYSRNHARQWSANIYPTGLHVHKWFARETVHRTDVQRYTPIDCTLTSDILEGLYHTRVQRCTPVEYTFIFLKCVIYI